MKRFYVLVEGQTEQGFVNTVLRDHFHSQGVAILPIVVQTKREKTGRKFTGGLTSYSQVRGDLRRLAGDRTAVAITTMFDYYRLPADFPGCTEPFSGSSLARIAD